MAHADGTPPSVLPPAGAARGGHRPVQSSARPVQERDADKTEKADRGSGLTVRADIIIVSWNGREDTLRSLETAHAQIAGLADPLSASAVVVDNGSTDGTVEAIRSRWPGCRVVHLSDNQGFTGGVAAGIRDSNADLLLLLNNDAVPEHGWLQSMIQSLIEAPEDVVAVGGKIVDISGKLADFLGGMMTFDGHAFQNGFRKPLTHVSEPANGSEILFACGGNMIVRRSRFLELGGFDSDYFAYLEDVDFGWRSWLSGSRILYNADGVVRHKSSATSDRLGTFERGVLFERNALQTALKNYEGLSLSAVAGPIFLTLLHRLHRYTTERNGDTSSLTRPAIGDRISHHPRHEPERGLSRWRRVLGRKIAARPGATVIDDPLTMMQFRAIQWFFQNSDHLLTKRERVQAMRKRTDQDIFQRFPLYYVPTYPGDSDLMSSRLFELLRAELPSRESSLEEIMAP